MENFELTKLVDAALVVLNDSLIYQYHNTMHKKGLYPESNFTLSGVSNAFNALLPSIICHSEGCHCSDVNCNNWHPKQSGEDAIKYLMKYRECVLAFEEIIRDERYTIIWSTAKKLIDEFNIIYKN